MIPTTLYHWLESDSPERQAWLTEQAKRTAAYFDGLPNVPTRSDGNEGKGGWSDGNEMDTEIPLDSSLSPDGCFLAYGMAMASGEQQRWRVRATADDSAWFDEVEHVYASGVVWDMAGQGFFYNRFWPWPGFHALYYHRLGTDQVSDTLIYQQPERPDWYYLPQPTTDGRYLVITVLRKNDWRNRLLVQNRQHDDSSPVALIPNFAGRYDFIMNRGTRFWLRAEEADHPQGRIITVDLSDPATWQEIVPETEWPLQQAIGLEAKWLALLYLKSACSHIKLVTPNGQPVVDLPLPGCGTVDDIALDDQYLTYSYTDFVTPLTDYRYHLHNQTTESSPTKTALASPNPADYISQQIWYPSRDGVPISMFLTYKRISEAELPKTGQHPVYLYVYGGFGEALTPQFSTEVMAWLDMGGVYAVANLRGGGEYGRAWHQAAVGHCKQVTFDDCLAAAEWLINQHYTCPARLALGGISNGGLTASACLTQRPDLFGAVIIESGLMDMLRFDQLGIGQDWLSEYGSPHQPDDLAVLQAYSPLHQIRANTHYPAMLIITHEQDPRVGEAHSFKFTAALQSAQAGEAPILLQVIPGQGHAVSVHNHEVTHNRLRFLADQLGIERKDT